MDELISYPYFATLEKTHDTSRTFKILLFSLGVLLAIVGFLLTLAGLFSESDMIPTGLVLLTLGGGGIFLARRAAATQKSIAKKIASKTSEYLVAERERLQELQNSMTVAEWESYKVQLQNQRILTAIKNKPTAARASTTTRTTMWIEEERE